MQLNMLEAMNIYVNVVEQGSFIRAAEVLELHRPAVTRAVQNLEHDWALSSCIAQHDRSV